MGPYLYLAAAPSEAVRVPTLTQPEGVRQFLENPPRTRHNGWNLVTLDRARLIGGNRLRVSNGERKHVDLVDDGTMLAIGAFSGFLGWGRWVFTERPKVNGLAVIEFAYDFCVFYEELLAQYVEPRPARVRFAVGVRHAHYATDEGAEKRLYLSPGPIGDLYDFDEYEREEAPASEFSSTFDFDVGENRPHFVVGAVAYSLVRRFYNWFGHTDDAVPYTNELRTEIDVERIRNLN